MKILLLSDTHSHLDESILQYAQQADEIWHAGDIGNISVTDTLEKIKPLRGVYGNIDGTEIRSAFHKTEYFQIDGIRFLMTHIGGYPKKYRPEIKKQLQEIQPNVFICGHSHILKIQYDKDLNLLHINPGAAGVYGFHAVRTMIRFEILGGQLKNMAVIELGNRH